MTFSQMLRHDPIKSSSDWFRSLLGLTKYVTTFKSNYQRNFSTTYPCHRSLVAFESVQTTLVYDIPYYHASVL